MWLYNEHSTGVSVTSGELFGFNAGPFVERSVSHGADSDIYIISMLQ